jgi:hypothetical protein
MDGKIACLMACVLASTALPAIAAAQSGKAAATTYRAPRNGLNQPDLSGTWNNTTLTRLERPVEFGDRQVLTPKEVAGIEGDRAQLLEKGGKPTDPNATTESVNKTCDLPGFPATADCAYNIVWTDAGERVMRVNGEPRSSLITFPANGRVPIRSAKVRPSAMGEGKADNPEDRILPERCLVSQNITAGALLNPTLYNNTYVIQQGRDSVAIVVEMAHDVRNIRLNAKHSSVPKWFGDSIGKWEGDTLVVDTINFHPEQLAYNSDKLHLIERFTRVGANRLLYQFRIEDPEAYLEPWGGEYEFKTSAGPQYEYACHEGNHGLEGILRGARADEKAGKVREVSAIAPER